MGKRQLLQGLLVLVLLAVVAVVGFGYWHSKTQDSRETVYFYDLSQQKLFPAPRSSVPPIAGLDGRPDGAVRAIVISLAGNPREKKDIKIAYLERYTSEMKNRFEMLRRAEATGQSTAGIIPHGVVPRNTLVRRPNETQWHVMTSPEGEKIVAEWNVPGPKGVYPAVCVP